MTAHDHEPIAPEDCKHECVNYGMLRGDSMHVQVTELCLHCNQSRAISYRRLNVGDWMSIDSFQNEYDTIGKNTTVTEEET
jgi:hypothetical protein